MNSKTQAQKGFKTFVLTLVISLAIFSVIYFLVNSSESELITQNTSYETPATKQDNLQVATLGENSKRSAFEDLAYAKTPEVTGQVLAGADASLDEVDELSEESFDDDDFEDDTVVAPSGTPVTAQTQEIPESTVPETGFFGPTFGLVTTTILIMIILYIFYLGPRKMALSSFEKDILDDLD